MTSMYIKLATLSILLILSSGRNGLVASAFSVATTPFSATIRRFRTLFVQNEKHFQNNEDVNTSSSDDAMPILPKNAVKYSQVPKEGNVFTETTIPKGLLNRHNTKAGTWGVIKILKGSLHYNIEAGNISNSIKKEGNEDEINNGEREQKMQLIKFILNSDSDGIIEPERLHEVAPVDGEEVEFVVEFHRVPGTGLVDEKRE
eukprot:CAMPEP_0168177906 /NCGR_PEP_ID=MMETSP0139_2-20121125/8764_1 /TAXON_ID=44445 /ORGANISM="Pseudo-nitzschia australis, Strain 10249 10 AB" /LENGTH=201 /DNA_ID=CAMNT_0008097109 /DNA_START=104 /DNA_END=709 /DNA_ORIENTATION=+